MCFSCPLDWNKKCEVRHLKRGSEQTSAKGQNKNVKNKKKQKNKADDKFVIFVWVTDERSTVTMNHLWPCILFLYKAVNRLEKKYVTFSPFNFPNFYCEIKSLLKHKSWRKSLSVPRWVQKRVFNCQLDIQVLKLWWQLMMAYLRSDFSDHVISGLVI